MSNALLPVPAPEWRLLAESYNTHHFACSVCTAAGRGEAYGSRCAAGAPLWAAYQAESAESTYRDQQ